MIIRIVKMKFREDAIPEFERLFAENKAKILASSGCMRLDLLQDLDDPTIFMTYSHWIDEESLKAYRHSTVFSHIWPKTKALFAAAPEAWSVATRHSD